MRAKAAYWAVGQLVEAEIDFYVRRYLLERCHSELIKLAVEHFEEYGPGVPIPAGYACAGQLRVQDSRGEPREAEALISLYLDGLYIVCERLWRATKALNVDTSDRMWRGIQKEPLCRRGRRNPVRHNLLETYSRSSDEAGKAAARIEKLLQVRGSRTHARHFCVGLEHLPEDPEPQVVYESENPYATQHPVVRISDADRLGWTNAIAGLLAWWCEESRRMLRVAASRR
jgi:hypothetical protein